MLALDAKPLLADRRSSDVGAFDRIYGYEEIIMERVLTRVLLGSKVLSARNLAEQPFRCESCNRAEPSSQ